MIIIELWQWDCRNTIAENVKKKRKKKEKAIVAMGLPK